MLSGAPPRFRTASFDFLYCYNGGCVCTWTRVYRGEWRARGGFCMHFISLCKRFSVRHVLYGKERKTEEKKKLATARVPHMAATNYPSGFGQGISSSGPVLFLSEAQNLWLLLKGSLSAPHGLLFWNPWVPPLWFDTLRIHVFLAFLFPLVNSILSSCISVLGNPSSVSLYYPGPIVSTQTLQMSGLYLQRKSTLCLLPVLFLELLEFGDWVSSWQRLTRVAGLAVISPALFCS